ncbi:TOMM biosynthesis cyclodehydratase protein C [Minicystis rosea]|nr:TOMM biosynthesis cyclodehydratase protein C [Minicystis rosea]
MSRIRLSSSASITPTHAGVILQSDLGTFQVTGADVRTFLERIAPLLDGSRDRTGITEALSDYAPQSVAAFLDLLRKRGLVEEVTAAAPGERARFRGQAEFLRKWGPMMGDPMDRLASARVSILGMESWATAAAIELTAAGIGAIQLFDDGDARRETVAAHLRGLAPWCRIEASPMAALDGDAAQSDLVVAAVPPADLARIERIARFAERAGRRCLWAHLDGGHAVLGPVSVPGRTACRLCAAADPINPRIAGDAATGHRAEMMSKMLGHLAALEIVKLISEYMPTLLAGQVLRVDEGTLETSLRTLVRIPWCRVCGKDDSRARAVAV